MTIFGIPTLQEIYDQARNASNNKDAFSAGFTAGQTMFTIEILSLIVGALESGGSSSGRPAGGTAGSRRGDNTREM